jgi:predicted DCC family thiol-disulfide oxidoreductase YuxK
MDLGLPLRYHLVVILPMYYPVHPATKAMVNTWIGDSPVWVYDGPCPLCNRVVSFLSWADKDERFRYVVQQSAVGTELAKAYFNLGPTDDIQTLNIQEEVWLATKHGLYTGADAALQSLVLTGGFWTLIGKLGLSIPKGLREAVYGWVSRNRYQMFKTYVCQLPAQKMLKAYQG